SAASKCYTLGEQFLLVHLVTNFSFMESLSMPHPSPRQRQQWIAWYFDHGHDVTATCRQFGMSRPTLYRWLARYTAPPTKPLHSRRLPTRRHPTWSTQDLRHLCEILGQQPTLGRERLTRLLRHHAAWPWSPATVGRMLRRLQPRCPFCRGRNGRHRSRDPHLRKDVYEITGGDLTSPELRPPPDPEVDFVIRDAEAVMHNPQG